MSLYRQIQSLRAQIIDTEKLLELVVDHPQMAQGLREKISLLKEELYSLPTESFEPKIHLLFSGNAVIGSEGIKSSFVSKTIMPFQEMIKTQVALSRFGKVGKRGQNKSERNAELYLTALPVGSFGVELSQLELSDLFTNVDVSKAMKDVMLMIQISATDDITFEAGIENVPKRNLTNLKKFLQEIVNEESVLKMESGELALEIPKEKVAEALNRVSSTIEESNEVFIRGLFRGLLLDSGKFEIQDENGKRISGFISDQLYEEELVEYDRRFLNQECLIHLNVQKTTFKTGNTKTDYELLEIKSLDADYPESSAH